GLRMLYPIDYASEVNIAWASIVAYPAGLHDRLVHRGRAVKTDRTRFVGKSGHGHGCHAVLQRDQHFVVFELPFVAADELILKIDYPLVGGRDFADKRETHLAVSANFLRLVGDALVSIGNFDHISGSKSHSGPGPWRVRQRRGRAPATAPHRRPQNHQT